MDAEFQYSSKENGGVHSSPPDGQTPPNQKVVYFDNVVGGGTGRHMMVDEGKLRNRLEPYNNIAVIATLLAGFALSIFPSVLEDDLTDSDFPWALTGHVLYNGLMVISFSINLVVTVMLTMELYFTQLLLARHSVAIAMRYLDSTEYSRRIAVFIFYTVSLASRNLPVASTGVDDGGVYEAIDRTPDDGINHFHNPDCQEAPGQK